MDTDKIIKGAAIALTFLLGLLIVAFWIYDTLK